MRARVITHRAYDLFGGVTGPSGQFNVVTEGELTVVERFLGLCIANQGLKFTNGIQFRDAGHSHVVQCYFDSSCSQP